MSVFCSYYYRYIKGRVSYDQANNAIDEIHKVITTKYKILRLPRSAMGEPVMKKYKVLYMDVTVVTELHSKLFTIWSGDWSLNKDYLAKQVKLMTVQFFDISFAALTVICKE